MRTLSTFIFLLISFSSLTSQSFVDEANIWHGSADGLVAGSFPVKYFLNGDTTLENQIYKRVFVTDPVNLFSTDTTYYGAIRETVDSIWLIPAISNSSQEILLYDWTTTLGDTLLINSGSSYSDLYVATTADSLELLNNEKRERLFIQRIRTFSSCTVDTIDYGYLIEGIGHSHTPPFNPFEVHEHSFLEELSLFEYGLYRCFTNEGSLLWMNEAFTSCEQIITSNSELKEDHFVEIFPNPARQSVSIKWDKEKVWKSVHIFSTIGQIMNSSNINITETFKNVDISLWPPGMYLVVLTDRKGNKITKKMICQ